ncbi:MAG TPA: hypothetical protein VH741_05130 [Candidatus Limnocylindrales bacterium]
MARIEQPSQPRPARAASAAPATREALMVKHAAARQRRDAARLGSDEFRAAAEEVARIEIAIAALEEPPPAGPG